MRSAYEMDAINIPLTDEKLWLIWYKLEDSTNYQHHLIPDYAAT